MNVLTGIQNFLNFLNENWTFILSIVFTIGLIVKKTVAYFSLSKKEQINIAKAQIKEIMLRLVTEAETDYQEMIKSGAIKRSQVIDEIFTMYPVLSKVTNQEEIISWIDNVIDDTLKEMRKVFEEQVAV